MHDLLVISGSQRLQKSVRDGKNWHVLIIRVMLWVVCDNVMHVVCALPPAQRKAAKEVGNDNSDSGVNGEVVSNTHVASVVGSEYKLVPEECEKHATGTIPAYFEAEQHKSEKERISDALNGVSRVVALEKPFVLDALAEYLVLAYDFVLSLRVQWRVGSLVKIQ